jgi:hypothetical protein
MLTAAIPVVAELIGLGTLLAVARETGLVVQRHGHEHVRVYVVMRAPLSAIDALRCDVAQPHAAHARALSLVDGWAPGLLDIVGASSTESSSSTTYAAPIYSPSDVFVSLQARWV